MTTVSGRRGPGAASRGRPRTGTHQPPPAPRPRRGTGRASRRSPPATGGLKILCSEEAEHRSGAPSLTVPSCSCLPTCSRAAVPAFQRRPAYHVPCHEIVTRRDLDGRASWSDECARAGRTLGMHPMPSGYIDAGWVLHRVRVWAESVARRGMIVDTSARNRAALGPGRRGCPIPRAHAVRRIFLECKEAQP